MRRMLFFLISCIFLGGCFSQKNIKQQDRSNIITDTVRVDFEKMYLSRLVEKVVQLKDYIGIINNSNSNQDSKRYYSHKAINLFEPKSIVIMKNNDVSSLVPIDSFFYLLENSAVNLCSVDSVYIPIWRNDKVLNPSDSIIYVDSYKFDCTSFISDKKVKGSSLPILIENTEDGKELMPLLGNLIVNVTTTTSKKADVENLQEKVLTFAHSLDIDKLEEKLYQCRIKLVDEFFDRFNGKESRVDIKSDDENFRMKNLLLLFDGKIFKSNEDPLFKEALMMVETIMNNDTKILYSDSTWFAKAECQAKFKGKPVSIVLYLNVERRKSDMFKWVISKVEGDILKLKPSFSSDKIMLMPDDHETNFMSLHRITTEKDDYITLYNAKKNHIDETSVFYSYVYNGLLDIDYVKDLEFIFLQVPGYTFSIKQIERDTYNSGWLIHSFNKMSNADKQQFLDSFYNN